LPLNLLIKKGNYMTPEIIALLAKAATIALGGMIPALSIGWIGSRAMEAIGRNPEASDRLFVPMLLGMAFAEAIAIYALVVTFTL
jgi:F-type H+-transporting ATPase subunit c